MKHSKKYTEAAKLVDPNKLYKLSEAIELAKKSSYTKFTGSLDVVVNLNVPTKYENDVVRGSIVFPHQTGPSKKVVVIAEAKDVKLAEDAGADRVGSEDLIKEIEEGMTDFDILIATPTMMPKMARLGKVLGPKGLMPNPKNETVTADVARVVKSYKAGKTDYKVNEQHAIKLKVGKLDQTDEQLTENFIAFLKASYNETRKFGPNRLRNIKVSPTMGPSMTLDLSNVLKELA